MQVEGHDEGDRLADNLARLLEQVALRVVLSLGRHGAVQAEVDPVEGVGGLGQGGQELVGQPAPVCLGQRPARRDGAGAVSGVNIGAGLREDLEGGPDFRTAGAVEVEEGVAPAHGVVLVMAEDRVKRRYLLHTLGDEYLGHGVCLLSGLGS